MSTPTPRITNGGPEDDEVLARRAHLAKLVKFGKRFGYGLFTIAIVVFAVGAISGFSATLVNIIVVALFIGSFLLIPAIVFGYGIRAADREDRQWGASSDDNRRRRA